MEKVRARALAAGAVPEMVIAGQARPMKGGVLGSTFFAGFKFTTTRARDSLPCPQR